MCPEDKLKQQIVHFQTIIIVFKTMYFVFDNLSLSRL